MVQGFMPIMFDRYAGDNKTQLPPEAKLYYLPDGKTLCLPASNVQSFLSAKNTTSIARLVGGKTYSSIADAFLSYVMVSPMLLPLTRNGEPIVFTGFKDGRDEAAGITVDRRVARLPKGIPNPKERPTVDLPWEVTFSLKIIKNDVIDETLLQEAIRRGGLAIGFGTFRGVYGKFTIARWE